MAEINHFSMANPAGAEQSDLPRLLARVSDELVPLGSMRVRDLTFAADVGSNEPWPTFTIYYTETVSHESSRRKADIVVKLISSESEEGVHCLDLLLTGDHTASCVAELLAGAATQIHDRAVTNVLDITLGEEVVSGILSSRLSVYF